MTRIIGGTFAGRRLSVPATGARPTTDRVRESLFNTLQHRLGSWAGVLVLDLFAGSGGVGLEALSRGAAGATLVERDRQALAVLRRNVAALGVSGSCEVVPGDALHWRPAAPCRYDVVFADPPYDTSASAVAGQLARLAAAGALSLDCIAVVERPSRDSAPPWPSDWAASDQRKYGETTLWYGGPQHGEDS